MTAPPFGTVHCCEALKTTFHTLTLLDVLEGSAAVNNAPRVRGVRWAGSDAYAGTCTNTNASVYIDPCHSHADTRTPHRDTQRRLAVGLVG